MSSYRFADLHVHSEYSHDCATPMLAIKEFARNHDAFVAITDHNEIGGALAARALKIPNIPAIEVTTKSLKDFLVYFYTYDDLISFYENTVLPAKDPGRIWGSRTTLTEEALLDALEDYECFVSLAHPYCPIPKRSAGLSNDIMRRLDAIEVMNFSMSGKANQRASLLADSMGKVHTAGSDSHDPSTLGAVTMRAHAETPQEFLTAVRQGTTMVVGYQRTGRDVLDKVKQFLAYKVSN